MADFTGSDVNTILVTLKRICPGEDAQAGNTQLSILAMALCIAARDCGVDPDQFMQTLEATYRDSLTREIVPLPMTQ